MKKKKISKIVKDLEIPKQVLSKTTKNYIIIFYEELKNYEYIIKKKIPHQNT